jgi:hypothetical protein
VPAIAARAHLTGTSLMPEKERKGSVSAMVVVAFEARGAVCDDGSRPLTAWPCPKVPARFPSPCGTFPAPRGDKSAGVVVERGRIHQRANHRRSIRPDSFFSLGVSRQIFDFEKI